MSRSLVLLTVAACLFAPSLRAQTFVKTILDEEETSGVAAAGEEDGCSDLDPDLVNELRPTRWDSQRSACFWRQQGLEPLRTARLIGTTESGTAAVELLSDIFWGLRVKVESGVTASEDEDDGSPEEKKTEDDEEAESNLQQLLATGGNLSISATYPWYAQQSSSGKVKSLFTSFVRIGGVLPVLGEDDESNTIEGEDLNASIELGVLEAETRIESFQGNITFIAFLRAGLVDGTKLFHASINNEDENAFAYGRIGAGFRFSDNITIVGSWTGYSADGLPGGQFALTLGMGR